MPLLIVVLGIVLLFILIARFKLNAFIAFIIVSLGVGIAEGMELELLVQFHSEWNWEHAWFFGHDFGIRGYAGKTSSRQWSSTTDH